jgi:hypothetical protein
MYLRLILASGEPVTLRRLGVGATAAIVRAKVSGFEPNELVGGITEGDRKVVVLAADLESASWPVPPQPGDQIEIRGTTLGVVAVDDSTRRVQGVAIAFDLIARG